jgi:N-acetylglucosamine malate deacetylase 1
MGGSARKPSRRLPRPGRPRIAAGPSPEAGADVLAFGAHPDDVELTCGGTLLKLKGLGYRIAVADCTRGEKGSRGDPGTRRREAENASRILGLAFRRNLGLPDTALEATPEAVRRTVELLRETRPTLVIAPFGEDPHPDHEACSRLVRRACFLSGLAKADAAGLPFRPSRILFAMGRAEFRPSFVVDVSAQFQRALEAIRAHRSQVSGPRSGVPRPDVLRDAEARARHYGSLIGAGFGEPFLCLETMEVRDPVEAFRDSRGPFGGGLR